MPIEIEKKYRVTKESQDEIAAALKTLGAVFIGEEFEENTVFTNEQLRRKNAVLRLRKTLSKTVITYKQRQESTAIAKHQLEHETTIEDAETAINILDGIGLTAALVYEKKRQTFTFRNVEIVLDELPFGMFVEIEGPLTAIAEAEMLLALDNSDVENETYPQMTSRFGVMRNGVIEARFS